MCLTCDIVKRKTVPPGGMLWRDDLVIAHQCLDVAIPGYFIVSPIRHVEEYSDLNDLEISRLSLVTKAIVRIVKELNDIEKVYILNFAEETAHFHWHLFPRYTWMLTQDPEYVYTGNRVDGAKLFSFFRETHKTVPANMNRKDILETIDTVRNALFQDGGLPILKEK